MIRCTQKEVVIVRLAPVYLGIVRQTPPEQTGVRLTSVTQYICELQRDWNRKETVPVFFQGLLDNGSFFVETLKEK